jgi:hypothetical protein
MISYQVGNQHYFNIFLALRQAWKTGGQVSFYCHDDAWSKFDWTKEPEASLDFLMTERVRQLRNQYDRLILLWSGGTDSHTIYNIFRQANIHIDEILIKTDDRLTMLPKGNVDWLRKNHWDPTTIITEYDYYDTELKMIDLQDEEWIWSNRGDLFKYGLGSAGDAIRFLCEKNHAGHTWKAIGGYDKPRLVYRGGRWYHRQLNLVLEATMGFDHLDHFYLDPLIAIKQSHMVKRAVKQILARTGQPLYDNDWAETKWPKDPAGYRDWAAGCGRHDELNLGVSFVQKQTNDAFDQTELNLTGSNWRELSVTRDQRLAHDLAENNPAAVNYVKGLYNLTTEHGFVDYLKDKGWFRNSSNCFTSGQMIWSREHDLGP